MTLTLTSYTGQAGIVCDGNDLSNNSLSSERMVSNVQQVVVTVMFHSQRARGGRGGGGNPTAIARKSQVDTNPAIKIGF